MGIMTRKTTPMTLKASTKESMASLLLHHAVERGRRRGGRRLRDSAPLRTKNPVKLVQKGGGVGLAGEDVFDKAVLVELLAAGEQGGHDGDSDAAADVAHEVEDAGGVAIFSRETWDMAAAERGMNMQAMAPPCMTWGQKMSSNRR